MKDRKLTPKQQIFCQEYIIDWNGTRAYLKAYPSVKKDSVARANASRLLTNANILNFINDRLNNLEQEAGVSALRVLLEIKKIAFSSMIDFHETWVTLKDFETLSDPQKACIQEITTQTRTITDPDGNDIQVDYVKIKLFDKLKALEALGKILNYYTTPQQQHTGPNGEPLFGKFDKFMDACLAKVLDPKDAREYIKLLKSEY